MKILKWSAAILLTLVLVSGLAAYFYLKSTLPNYDGHRVAKKLHDKVEIIRDSFGMPHIYAHSDEDAYFALGLCQAQDRLFQMDLARRAGRGRLSEILGTPLVKVDKMFRTLNATLSLEEWATAMGPAHAGPTPSPVSLDHMERSGSTVYRGLVTT